MDLLINLWPWYVAGPLLTFVMFSFFGENFGVSSNSKRIYTISGAGKFEDSFKIDVKKKYWNLAFILGSMIGGFLAVQYLILETAIDLAPRTIDILEQYGFVSAGQSLFPDEIFGLENLTSFSGIIILLVGAF